MKLKLIETLYKNLEEDLKELQEALKQFAPNIVVGLESRYSQEYETSIKIRVCEETIKEEIEKIISTIKTKGFFDTEDAGIRLSGIYPSYEEDKEIINSILNKNNLNKIIFVLDCNGDYEYMVKTRVFFKSKENIQTEKIKVISLDKDNDYLYNVGFDLYGDRLSDYFEERGEWTENFAIISNIKNKIEDNNGYPFIETSGQKVYLRYGSKKNKIINTFNTMLKEFIAEQIVNNNFDCDLFPKFLNEFEQEMKEKMKQDLLIKYNKFKEKIGG